MDLVQIAAPAIVAKPLKRENEMKQKKQSLVEYAESKGFTRAADDDPIYTEGIVIVSTVGAELERLEQEESSQELPKDKP